MNEDMTVLLTGIDLPEVWRPIPGLDGRYDASTIGRIRSNARLSRPNAVLRGYIFDNGSGVRYRRVVVSANGKSLTRPVHILVALAFHGERPASECHTRHLDGDSLNNCATNLKWGSVSENTFDRVRHGTHNQSSKTHCRQGHEYTVENTYWTRNRSRSCVTCTLDRNREYKRKRRLRMGSTTTALELRERVAIAEELRRLALGRSIISPEELIARATELDPEGAAS